MVGSRTPLVSVTGGVNVDRSVPTWGGGGEEAPGGGALCPMPAVWLPSIHRGVFWDPQWIPETPDRTGPHRHCFFPYIPTYDEVYKLGTVRDEQLQTYTIMKGM